MLHSTIIEIMDKIDAMFELQQVGNPLLSDQYVKFPMHSNAFSPISPLVSEKNNHIIACVDGGNNELLGSVNFSLQLNRIYFNLFRNNARMQPKKIPQKIEYLSLTIATARNTKIYYETTLHAVNPAHSPWLPKNKDLIFDSFNNEITQGKSRADISQMAAVARRFTELNTARLLCEEELESGDIIIMDGTLEMGYPNEVNYAQDLFSIAVQKGVYLTALSKSTRIYTDTGLGLISSVIELAKLNHLTKWYLPIAEGRTPDKNAIIFVTKLHEQAVLPFRFELLRPQYQDISEKNLDNLFSIVAFNTQDISFPGYPYGLIEADHRARVRFEEIERYKTLLLAEASKKPDRFKNILRDIGGLQTHEILNDLAPKSNKSTLKT